MDIRDASDYTLVAELERRGFFSKLARMVENGGTQTAQQVFAGPSLPVPQRDYDAPPKPPLGRFIPGTDREMPKGARSVVEIPDRSNKDGSQLRLITVDGPGVRDDEKPQFIVKGAEREALAQSFIDQWKDEITLLENRLAAEVLNEEEITAIWSEIDRLQRQITTRATSAFGSMGIEQVKAANIALNGAENVLDAKSEAGVVGRGVQIVTSTGFPEFDDPNNYFLPCFDASSVPLREIEQVLAWDPFILHLPQPVMSVTPEMNIKILGSPLVIWRILFAVEERAKRLHLPVKDAQLALLYPLAEMWNRDALPGHPAITLEAPSPASAFAAGWTSMLQSRYRNIKDEDQRQGIKRTIRILNVDFQEREAPDFMFDSDDRPHVNPRAAWTEVQEGPGVFRMKRREPLDHNDPDEEARD